MATLWPTNAGNITVNSSNTILLKTAVVAPHLLFWVCLFTLCLDFEERVHLLCDFSHIASSNFFWNILCKFVSHPTGPTELKSHYTFAAVGLHRPRESLGVGEFSIQEAFIVVSTPHRSMRPYQRCLQMNPIFWGDCMASYLRSRECDPRCVVMAFVIKSDRQYVQFEMTMNGMDECFRGFSLWKRNMISSATLQACIQMTRLQCAMGLMTWKGYGKCLSPCKKLGWRQVLCLHKHAPLKVVQIKVGPQRRESCGRPVARSRKTRHMTDAEGGGVNLDCRLHLSRFGLEYSVILYRATDTAGGRDALPEDTLPLRWVLRGEVMCDWLLKLKPVGRLAKILCPSTRPSLLFRSA